MGILSRMRLPWKPETVDVSALLAKAEAILALHDQALRSAPVQAALNEPREKLRQMAGGTIPPGWVYYEREGDRMTTYTADPSKPGNVIGPNGQSVPAFTVDPRYTGTAYLNLSAKQRMDALKAYMAETFAARRDYLNQLDNDRDRYDFMTRPPNKDLQSQFEAKFPGGHPAYTDWLQKAYTGDPRNKSATMVVLT